MLLRPRLIFLKKVIALTLQLHTYTSLKIEMQIPYNESAISKNHTLSPTEYIFQKLILTDIKTA